MKVYYTHATLNDNTSFGKAGARFGQELAHLCELVDARGAPSADLQVYFGTPSLAHEHRWRQYARRFLWYTPCESHQVPQDELDRIQASDGLLTPSTWCADVFEDLGVTVPTFVVPHGVSAEDHPYVERPADRDTFTFLWIGVCAGHLRQVTEFGRRYTGERKRGWLARQAFEELDLPGDARLVLKSIPYPVAPKDFCYRVRNGRATIRDVAAWMDGKEYKALFAEADCFVWPSWGEGFGMIPLEAMATGLPAIIPNYSGMTDYWDPRFCIGLPFTIGRQWDCMPYEGALIDVEDLKAAMLWAYEHREWCRRAGAEAAEHVRTHWTWERAVRHAMRGVLDYYA